MEHEYIYEGARCAFDCQVKETTCAADIDGERFEFEFQFISPNCISLLGKNEIRTVYLAREKNSAYIFIEGEKYSLKIPDETAAFDTGSAGIGGGLGLVETPMPGTIIKFLVGEGDIVEEGQGLVIVEAMKMENEIRAPLKGRVNKINFKPGDTVDLGQSIIDLGPVEDEI